MNSDKLLRHATFLFHLISIWSGEVYLSSPARNLTRIFPDFLLFLALVFATTQFIEDTIASTGLPALLFFPSATL